MKRLITSLISIVILTTAALHIVNAWTPSDATTPGTDDTTPPPPAGDTGGGPPFGLKDHVYRLIRVARPLSGGRSIR